MCAWRPQNLRRSSVLGGVFAGIMLVGLGASFSLVALHKGNPMPWIVPDPPKAETQPPHTREEADKLAQEQASNNLPPSEPTEPLSVEESLAAMTIAPGFRIDAVAAEPLVQTPVSMQFDESGRLWVVQMPAYMRDVDATGETQAINQIVILEDQNDDGLFERSTTFADGLVLPRSVAPVTGGALVLEPPSLYYFEDVDNDGRADRKHKLLDGFGGIENPEHAGNGLVRGPDNIHHLSQHGVDVTITFEPGGKPKVRTRQTSGHGQWGVTFDDRGRLYYTPNSTPLLLDIYPKQLSIHNSNFVSPAGIGDNIAQPSAAVYPVRETPGVNRGYQPGVLRADRTLASVTAACSPIVNRSGTLGTALIGDVFICEPAAGVVKRIAMRTESDGVPRGKNAYEKSEFLASTDERFRPVATAIGPDGCLYIADMYRGVIQHKTYITEYLKKQVKERGLEGPLTYGRIYRIAPQGHVHKPFPHLNTLSDEMLIKLLSHSDGYYRDTAQRLLCERAQLRPASAARIDPNALDELRAVMRTGEDWRTRLHALGTLSGMGVMIADDLDDASRDIHPAVRAFAMQLGSLTTPSVDVQSVRDRALASGDISEAAIYAALAGSLNIGVGDAAAIIISVESAVVREALLAGLTAPRSENDEGSEPGILRALIGNGTFPVRESDYVIIERLADACLRSSPAAKHALADTTAAVIGTRGDAAGKLLGTRLATRITQHMRLSAAQPRVLKLNREPVVWTRLISGERKITEGYRRARPAPNADSPSPESTLPELATPPDHIGEPVTLPAYFVEAVDYFDWPGKPVRPGRVVPVVRPLTVSENDLFSRGKELYSKCVGCHQSEGQGAPGQAPTLAASPLLTGHPDNAIKVLLQGLEGPYTHGSAEFNGVMPAAPLETDAEIAAVLTFARRSFGNVSEPITAATVGRVRAATTARRVPWKREELLGQSK